MSLFLSWELSTMVKVTKECQIFNIQCIECKCVFDTLNSFLNHLYVYKTTCPICDSIIETIKWEEVQSST